MTKEEREKAIDALKISAPIHALTEEEFNDYIQTLNKIMDWLEQEPCEDAISRQEVLSYLCAHCPDNAECFDDCDDIKNIKALLSVKPQESKTGHWIRVTDKAGHLVWECDKCGWQQRYNTNFCPDCGVKMESEEKHDTDR